MRTFVGTSGFAYREWRGVFYPPGLRTQEMLSFYAGKLPAVEINSTFYRIPRRETLAEWAEQVPDGFRFAFKVPAVITHRRRFREAEEPLARFLEATSVLGERRGPLLFQLPPWFSCDLPLLEQFLPLLRDVPAAFEFRHPSWFDETVYQALRDAGCALCVSDRDEVPAPPVISTASFGYLRLRRNDYTQDDLAQWWKVAASQGWKEIFLFFRHEETGRGPQLAHELLGLLS